MLLFSFFKVVTFSLLHQCQSYILYENTKLSLLCKFKVLGFREFWVEISAPAISMRWHQVAVELFIYILCGLV